MSLIIVLGGVGVATLLSIAAALCVTGPYSVLRRRRIAKSREVYSDSGPTQKDLSVISNVNRGAGEKTASE